MMRLRRLTSCVVLALAVVLPARADRDIVYSARYYYPPGDHRTSHFHLYRINPDGTGRMQLTFGRHDDTAPKWSPDGRKISFTRDGIFLCVLRVGGGIKPLMGNRYDAKDPHTIFDDVDGAVWLPDSRSLIVLSDSGDAQGEVIDVQTGQTTGYIADALDYLISPSGRYAYLQCDKVRCSLEQVRGRSRRTVAVLSAPLYAPAWLDDRTLMGLTNLSEAPAQYVLMNCGGAVSRRGRLHWAETSKPDYDPITPGPRFLQGIPGDSHHALFASDQDNSTVRPKLDFYEVTAANGALGWFLRSRQFVAFSPNGHRYCTAPSRDLSPYSRRKYPLANKNEDVTNRHHMVWTAPLQTGQVARRNLKTITPGLVWVTGADWRKETP